MAFLFWLRCKTKNIAKQFNWYSQHLVDISGGSWEGLMVLCMHLMFFVAINYITGVMVAVLEKKLSSEIGFRVIIKNPHLCVGGH
jgi:phage-related holin